MLPERAAQCAACTIILCVCVCVCVSGRVVNVSSFVGSRTLNQCSPALQERFRSEDITEDELVGLMQKFVDEVKAGEHKKGGWPDTAYGMSKTGLTVRHIAPSPSTDLNMLKNRRKLGEIFTLVSKSGAKEWRHCD